MSDRTMIDVAGKSYSVPRPAKRALQVLTVTGLTALVSLCIVAGNALLTGKGGPIQGFNVWYSYITRPDILASCVLTAVIAVACLSTTKGGNGNNGRR